MSKFCLSQYTVTLCMSTIRMMSYFIANMNGELSPCYSCICVTLYQERTVTRLTFMSSIRDICDGCKIQLYLLSDPIRLIRLYLLFTNRGILTAFRNNKLEFEQQGRKFDLIFCSRKAFNA